MSGMDPWQQINAHLKTATSILNNDDPVTAPENWRVGVDLGTASIVAMLVDERGHPHAAFLEWARVVRDGVVVDYHGATQIVKKLLGKIEQKCAVEITSVATSYPPGTDARLSTNVIESAGRDVLRVEDEPSCVARLLPDDRAAVVDVGGGTTGVAILEDGKVVYSADEPGGGEHVTLTLAGNLRIPFDEAEQLKRSTQNGDYLNVVTPVFEKLSDIARDHVKRRRVEKIYLTGGTFLFSGSADIFRRELPGYDIVLPEHLLLLTPLAIAGF